MADKFVNVPDSLIGSAMNILDITPNDSVDLTQVCKGLIAASSGVTKVTLKGGTTGSFYAVQGVIYPMRVVKVFDTGTTPTSFAGLY